MAATDRCWLPWLCRVPILLIIALCVPCGLTVSAWVEHISELFKIWPNVYPKWLTGVERFLPTIHSLSPAAHMQILSCTWRLYFQQRRIRIPKCQQVDKLTSRWPSVTSFLCYISCFTLRSMQRQHPVRKDLWECFGCNSSQKWLLAFHHLQPLVVFPL